MLPGDVEEASHFVTVVKLVFGDLEGMEMSQIALDIAAEHSILFGAQNVRRVA